MFFNKKDSEKNVLPFIDGLTFPIEKIFAYFREFALLICSVSLITSLLIIWLQSSFFCDKMMDEIPVCSYSSVRLIVFLLCIWFLSAMVYNRWQMIFAENYKFLDTFKKSVLKKDLKAGFILFLHFICWCSVLGGLFWLNIRKPVADWRIEAAFFVGVSLLIIVTLLLLLNFAVFQHFFKGGRFFAINKTFLVIFDNMHKPVTWFLIYFLIVVFLLKEALSSVFYNQSIVGDFRVFLMSFCSSLIFYFVVTLISGSLFYQEQQLFGEEK